MTDSASIDLADSRTLVARAEAGFLGDDERPQFAWLHRPAGGNATVALVIVPPFGYEAICSKRALRHLAEDAARAGLLALRFDPDGTGNSAGNDLDDDRLRAWINSVHRACELAHGEGAQRIVLAGVRFGAMLATLAAAERNDVSGLIAIAGVTSGKAYMRECRMLQISLNLAPAFGAQTEATSQSVHEVVGFALSAETRTALAAIDLCAGQSQPAPRVLLIERNDMPQNKAWAEQLASLGVAVEATQLPGYAEMMLDPHHAAIPQAMLDAAIAFAVATAHSTPASPAAPTASASLRTRVDMPFEGAVLREEVVVLDQHMTGIATYPRSAIEHAVILLNAGAIGMAGPNRLYVELARRLASRGDLVLRFDLSGIADSATPSAEIENTVYSGNAIAEVAMAVAWAQRVGARFVSVAGLCSGAYHALRAALAGQPIDRIVVINPLTFHYRPGMPLDYSAARVTEDVRRYARSVKRTDSWKKLLHGEVNVLHLARNLLLRGRMVLWNKLRDISRGLPIRLGDDLGRDLLDVAQRGVIMRFVFSASDPGHAMLREQGGSVVEQLMVRGELGITIIDGADHTFTARWTHEPMLTAVAGALDR